jgi:hypothetical protein
MHTLRAKGVLGLIIGTGIFVISAPVQAQSFAPSNIPSSTSLNGIAGSINPGNIQFQPVPLNLGAEGGIGIFSGLPVNTSITAGGWANPTQNITNGANPLGGLFNANSIGGLLGNSNPLGGLLGGGSGGGGDLLGNIQGLLGNLDRIAKDPLTFLVQILGGTNNQPTPTSTLPDALASIEAVLKRNKADMGLPDLAQAKLGVWETKPSDNPWSALDLFHLKQGQVVDRATQVSTQTVLGKEGQQLQKQGMQAVVAAIGGAKQVVAASGQVAQQSSQFAQQAGQVAQQAGQVGQQSTQSAGQITTTAGKIKSAISTQDAIKGLGEQNAQLGNILAGISNQLGLNSNQSSSMASELAGLSSQAAQTNGQLGEVAAISGDQAISLRNLQITGAITNANLNEVSSIMHGQKRQAALEKEAITTLPSVSPMILFR